MKTFCKNMCLVVLLAVLMFPLAACHKDTLQEEPDFLDDVIYVTIRQEFKYVFYTLEDFSEINAVELTDRIPDPFIYSESEVPPTLTPAYTQGFKLRIAVPGKQNVLDAIEVLKGYEFVLDAEPHYLYDIDYDI